MIRRRNPNQKQDPAKLAAFLATETFEEYLTNYESFHGLVMGKDTFAHEMKLMEADTDHTHRQKESLLQKKKRDVVKSVRAEIDVLRDDILTHGVWKDPANVPDSLLITIPKEDGKSSATDQEILRRISLNLEETDTTLTGEVLTDFREELEALSFPKKNLFRGTTFEDTISDPVALALVQMNRICEIEAKMEYLNYYTEEFSNMKSVSDPILRKVLTEQHARIGDFRNEIYEELLTEGTVRGKWISEQTAFRIVRSHFPDARYQYHAPWLGYQSLDIYIPSRKAAIEYQGKQHTEAVEFFGGEEALLDNRMRDRRKRAACEKNGVKLITWNFDQPLNEEFFESELMPQLETQK